MYIILVMRLVIIPIMINVIALYLKNSFKLYYKYFLNLINLKNNAKYNISVYKI